MLAQLNLLEASVRICSSKSLGHEVKKLNNQLKSAFKCFQGLSEKEDALLGEAEVRFTQALLFAKENSNEFDL